MNIMGQQWIRRERDPVITRSVVQSLAPAVDRSECPWARYRSPNCSWCNVMITTSDKWVNVDNTNHLIKKKKKLWLAVRPWNKGLCLWAECRVQSSIKQQECEIVIRFTIQQLESGPFFNTNKHPSSLSLCQMSSLSWSPPDKPVFHSELEFFNRHSPRCFTSCGAFKQRFIFQGRGREQSEWRGMGIDDRLHVCQTLRRNKHIRVWGITLTARQGGGMESCTTFSRGFSGLNVQGRP